MNDLVLLATTNSQRARVFVDKHLHGYATIQFAENICGALMLSYDAQFYEWENGKWFFPAHPGPHLKFHPRGAHDNWHHRHIGFAGPLVEKWRAAGLWLERPQRAPDGEDFGARMDELIGWARRGDALARRRTINGLEGLLLQLAEARQDLGGDAWLADVLARLEEQNAPDLTLLARELGLSDTLLRRRFKAATGQTLQEWIIGRRIRAAQILLSDSDWPLRAVAARLGYRNEYFFSRQFKTVVGVAPGAFRKSRLTTPKATADSGVLGPEKCVKQNS